MKQRTLRKFLRDTAGVTFIEILTCVFIVTIGIMSSLLYMTTAQAATELAKDKTTAVSHAELLLEDMKSRSTLASITSTNWTTFWSSFVTTNSLTALPSETVTVTYVNAAADPLAITVAISWTKKSKNYSVSLATEMTK